LISRNSKRLLYLINRILDLSKLEAGKLQPDYVLGDIVAYLRYITESFHSLAQSKEVQLIFYNEVENLEMESTIDINTDLCSLTIGDKVRPDQLKSLFNITCEVEETGGGERVFDW